MANIVIYDATTKRVSRYLKSVHTPDYISNKNILINPSVEGIDLNYAKVYRGTVLNLTTTEKDAVIAKHKIDNYRVLRATEYPAIGDQLDAILKQLNYDRMNGRELIQDMDDIVGLWLGVKDKYPKV